MKLKLATGEPTSVRIRRARLGDVAEIVALYLQAYTPRSGGEAADHYPFPQIFRPEWVAEAVTGAEIVWVVADDDGVVIGSAAAVRNISRDERRVAEVFGVVVAPMGRRRGVASALLKELVEFLDESTDFIICEARTAEAGGWMVARNAGFVPIGFEPFAHAMPVGFESMVLTLRNLRRDAGNSLPLKVSDRASKLRAAILGDEGSAQSAASPIAFPSATPSVTATIEEFDEAFMQRLQALRDCPSCVALSRPLLGRDERGSRFEHFGCIVRVAGEVVGAAYAFWDRIDARMRLLEFRSRQRTLDSMVLAAALACLDRRVDSPDAVTVACVDARYHTLHEGFESLGFVPTAYYSLTSGDGVGYGDAVQYTRLSGRFLRFGVEPSSADDWLAAHRVIAQVSSFVDCRRELLSRERR